VATRRELPADFAAALDRFPAARDRFAGLPVERQHDWLNWIERGRGRRGRSRRIDEAMRRLSPRAGAAEEEVAEPLGPPPDRYWWLWLLLLLLLVIAGIILWLIFGRGNGKTTVPDVVGLHAPAAAVELHRKHLKSFPVTGASSKPTGVVFAQSPGAGRRVDKNSSVTISISTGPARKAVPDVIGLKLAAAQARITAAGLTAKVERHASTRPKGIVFTQQPLAGVTALKGATVILSVSTGVKPVTVPSLVGDPQGAAVTALQKVGLKPALKNVPSAQAVGQVVSQKPPAGTKVDKGSTVLLNVSKGAGTGTTTATTATTATTSTVTTSAAPAILRVPATRSLAVTAGVRRLNTAGFRPIVRYVASSKQAGIIVAQSPASGTALRGSRVRVSVSEGPNPNTPATVPDVISQDQSTAASTLRQAGFKVLVLFRKTTNQAKDGLVIDQQPAAGSSIPTGSYVAIFIGRFTG
jgi:serine/threonine-protein kinase